MNTEEQNKHWQENDKRINELKKKLGYRYSSIKGQPILAVDFSKLIQQLRLVTGCWELMTPQFDKLHPLQEEDWIQDEIDVITEPNSSESESRMKSRMLVKAATAILHLKEEIERLKSSKVKVKTKITGAKLRASKRRITKKK